MKKITTIIISIVLLMLQSIAYASERKLSNEEKLSILSASFEDLKVLVEGGLDINSVNLYGGNLVSYIAFSESPDTLEKWIELGANVDKKNVNGTTPLNFAIAGNNVQVVEFLIKLGVNINHKNLHGSTPLHYAIIGLHSISPKISIILIEAGADVNTLDGEGKSPLHHLREQKKIGIGTNEDKIEKMLISRGAKDISLYSDVQTKDSTTTKFESSTSTQPNRSNQYSRKENHECRVEDQQKTDENCKVRR